MSQTTLDQTADPASTSKGARTRQAILAAAIARFGREGFRATSVADIARDAGVGGTVAYTYFPNKEALFLAAIDEDAAGLIRTGLDHLEAHDGPEWRHTLLFFVAGAVDHHPLARRLLAGLEPEVTGRVLEIPALADLRRACGQRLRDDQQTGRVRTDIDTDLVGNGVVAILLSLLMSIVQVGDHSALPYADAVDAVFRAAIEPPRADTGALRSPGLGRRRPGPVIHRSSATAPPRSQPVRRTRRRGAR